MKFQAIVLASFLVMPYALADDQGGLKQDAAPPPPHAIEDGYRGTDDAKKMTVDFAKKMHDGASVSLRGNLISHKGEDRYVIPSTAIKTFILPSIISLRLWCGVFPRLP